MAAPLVARHFDYLDSLIESGNAPVGPTTVKRFLKLAGGLPRVRFGSTETCLQVLGISYRLSQEEVQAAFERGRSHEFDDEPKIGYYIGRPHPPHTKARVVKSTASSEPGDEVKYSAGIPLRGQNFEGQEAIFAPPIDLLVPRE